MISGSNHLRIGAAARRGICGLLLLVAGGCAAPLPIYERPPFWSKPDALGFIEVRHTHKSEVAAALGAPDLHRADGRVWVYTEGQTRGMVVGESGGPLIAEHMLLITFDNANVVTARGVFQDTRGCLLSGICFASYWHDDGSAEQFGMNARHDAMPVAMDFYLVSTSIDPFQAPADACRLLLYARPDAERGLIRLLDAGRQAILFWWTLGGPYVIEQDVAPGSYWLTLSIEESGFATPWVQADPAMEATAVDCRPGETRVVRHTVDSGFWRGRTGEYLELIADETASSETSGYVLVSQPSDADWLAVIGYQGEQP